MVEFPQSVPNLTEASTNLYELLKGRNFAATLRARRAVSRRWRGWRGFGSRYSQDRLRDRPQLRERPCSDGRGQQECPVRLTGGAASVMLQYGRPSV